MILVTGAFSRSRSRSEQRPRAILNFRCGGEGDYIPSADNDGEAGPDTAVGTVEDRARHIRDNVPEMC
jgi:hypothetical protein